MRHEAPVAAEVALDYIAQAMGVSVETLPALSLRQREVITALFWHAAVEPQSQPSLKTIAEQLGISPQAVQQHYGYAKEKLARAGLDAKLPKVSRGKRPVVYLDNAILTGGRAKAVAQTYNVPVSTIYNRRRILSERGLLENAEKRQVRLDERRELVRKLRLEQRLGDVAIAAELGTGRGTVQNDVKLLQIESTDAEQQLALVLRVRQPQIELPIDTGDQFAQRVEEHMDASTDKPMTSRQIAEKILAESGVELTKREFHLFRHRVINVMTRACARRSDLRKVPRGDDPSDATLAVLDLVTEHPNLTTHEIHQAVAQKGIAMTMRQLRDTLRRHRKKIPQYWGRQG